MFKNQNRTNQLSKRFNYIYRIICNTSVSIKIKDFYEKRF